MSPIVKAAGVAVALVLCSPAHAVDDGNRDRRFNARQGYASVAFDLPTLELDSPLDALAQPDGGIVLAGYASGGAGNDTNGAVARLHPDGSADWQMHFQLAPDTNTEVRAVALQADGLIVVAGAWSATGPTRGFVARLTADGALDTSFGSAGAVWDDLPELHDVAIHPDGRILAAGRFTGGTAADMLLLAFRPDGTREFTSIVDFTPLGQAPRWSNDEALAVAAQPDGKILLAGYGGQIAPEMVQRFAVARLKADGGLDDTFGDLGRQTVGFDWCTPGGDISHAFATAVAIDSIGRVILGGYGEDTGCDLGTLGTRMPVLAALTSTGQIDTEFGAGGRVVEHLFTEIPGWGSFQDLAVQADDRIVLVGHGPDASMHSTIGAVRLLPDGSFDPTFVGDGMGRYDFGVGETDVFAVAMQGPHPIVVGRWRSDPGMAPSNTDFLAIRLIGDRIFGHDYEP